jgi:predicted aspartyl protease
MQTEITFRFAGNKLPLLLVPTLVNGRGPFEFLVDTGASHCVLSADVAHLLGLSGEEASAGRDAGGTFEVVKGQVASLSVGAVTRENLAVGITDLSTLSQTLATPIAGTLGTNYFQGLRLTIDYQQATLRLVESIQVDVCGRAEAGTALALNITPLPVVPVMVNEQGPFSFLLDTGAATTVISPELANQFELLPTEDRQMKGAKSTAMGSKGVLSSIAVGTALQLQSSVTVADIFGPLRQESGMKLDGILGNSYLRAYRMTIDYANATLLLEASA